MWIASTHEWDRKYPSVVCRTHWTKKGDWDRNFYKYTVMSWWSKENYRRAIRYYKVLWGIYPYGIIWIRVKIKVFIEQVLVIYVNKILLRTFTERLRFRTCKIEDSVWRLNGKFLRTDLAEVTCHRLLRTKERSWTI